MWSVSRPRSRRLSRYWNARTAGRAAAEIAPLAARLEPSLVEAIDRLAALDDAQLPDPTFVERLEGDLMRAIALDQRRLTLLPPAGARPGNGRYGPPSRPLPRPTLPGRARRWAGTQLATAIMLILVLLGSLYVFYDNRPAAVPPLQASPTAAPATPDATPEAAAWPVGLGANAGRTRAMPGPGPVGEPLLLWHYPPADQPAGVAPVRFGMVADGVIYVSGGDSGGFAAIDLTSGTELWRSSEVGGAGVIDGNGIVALSAQPGGAGHDLLRINRADGSVVWRLAAGIPRDNLSPVVAGGVGYVPGASDLTAFDPATGERLWSVPLDAPASRGAAVAGDLAVLGDVQGTIYGIATTGGDVVWTAETDATTIGHPSLAGGTVYIPVIGGATESVLALDTTTGAERWRFVSPNGGSFYGTAVGETTVYVTNVDGVLYALDAATGALRWSFQTDGADSNSPTLIGDTVYLAGPEGTLYVVDAVAGTERWRYRLDAGCDFSPVVVDGVVYVGTLSGSVYAIGGSESAAAAGLAPAPSDATVAVTAAPAVTAAAGGSEPVVFQWATSGNSQDRLQDPGVAAIDPSGRIWVNDISGRFFIFDLDGNLVETWGTEGDGPGQFRFISSEYGESGQIAFAPDGGFYVADFGNARVQQFDRDRVFVREWGTKGEGEGQFMAPSSVVVDTQGNVLVGDAVRNDIQRFSADGVYLGLFGAAHLGTEPFEDGIGVMYAGPDGVIWVGLVYRGEVAAFDPTGQTLLRTYAFGGFDLATDGAGHFFGTNQETDTVLVMDELGNVLYEFGGTGTGPGEFIDPTSLIVYRGTSLIVVEWHGNRIQKFRIVGPFPPVDATPTP